MSIYQGSPRLSQQHSLCLGRAGRGTLLSVGRITEFFNDRLTRLEAVSAFNLLIFACRRVAHHQYLCAYSQARRDQGDFHDPNLFVEPKRNIEISAKMTLTPSTSEITYRQLDPQNGAILLTYVEIVRQSTDEIEEDFERAVQVMVSSFSISESLHLSSPHVKADRAVPTWTKFYRGKDTSRARAKAIYYLRAVGHLGEIWATEGTNEAAESVIAFIPPGTVYSEA